MNIGIIGLGLLGGSFGRAIIKKTNHKVLGADISKDVMLKAKLLDAFNEPLTEQGFKSLDVLLVCLTPNAAIKEIENACPKLKKGAVVMDIAGTKRKMAAEMKRLSQIYPNVKFVATHPMAGREFSGIGHSTPTLFEKAPILITNVSADIKTVTLVKGFLTDVGFGPIKITTADEHDKMIAYTSELPHIISSCYVLSPSAENHDGFSAGSFKDITRVARINADMWTELFLENKDNLLNELDIFIGRLQSVREFLKNDDAKSIKEHLSESNAKKELIDKTSRERRKNGGETNKD